MNSGKKCWAGILGVLLPILTVFFAPEHVEMTERVCLAIVEAGVAAGFIFAEASVDKAAVKNGKKGNGFDHGDLDTDST